MVRTLVEILQPYNSWVYDPCCGSGSESDIRKNIINADLVDCIVAMPSQLFYTTQIPVSLWFLTRNKRQKRNTLFIFARKMDAMVTRKLRELTDLLRQNRTID